MRVSARASSWLAKLSITALMALHPSAVRAEEPAWQLLVDAPLMLSAQPAPSGVGTEVLAWPSLRAGALFELHGPLLAGFDAALSGTYASAGTEVVGATRVVGSLQARGLLGASFGGKLVRITPYLHAGAVGATGPSLVRGGNSDVARLLVAGGGRGGGGVMFTLGIVSVRSELAGGYLGGKPEVTTSLALGLAL